MLEEVGGMIQGACIPFIDGNALRKGNNRLAFAPDGSLWGQRIVFTGKPPADIYSINLTENGFDLTFTQPLNEASASDLANYKFKNYYYEYHKKYGSDHFDVQTIPVSGIKISGNRKKVSLTLSTLKPGYIYELSLSDIKTAQGGPLTNKIICYTLNKLINTTDSRVK